jgi:hypothetical protein
VLKLKKNNYAAKMLTIIDASIYYDYYVSVKDDVQSLYQEDKERAGRENFLTGGRDGKGQPLV